jgi:CspA family cold shock protein
LFTGAVFHRPAVVELPCETVGDAFLMRQNGTVKFFNQAKGYGFISPEDGGKDVFVHITAVQRSGIPELNENMKISFEVQPDKKGRGPQAVNLQLI